MRQFFKFVGAGLILFLLECNQVNAQRIPNGTSAVEVGGGATYSGSSFYGAYVRYFKDNSNKVGFGHLPCPGHKTLLKFFPNRMYGKASIFYEHGSKKSIKYTATGLDLAFYYALLKIGESVFINLKGGAIVSSDKMDSNAEKTIQAQKGINYGVLAGAELEWFLSRKFTLVLGGDQRFFFNNKEPLENLRGYGYGGIRYNFIKNVDRIF